MMEFEEITMNGKPFACSGWNGDKWLDCWELAFPGGRYPADGWENKSIAIQPILKQIDDDDFEIIGYEEA